MLNCGYLVWSNNIYVFSLVYMYMLDQVLIEEKW